MPQMRTSIKIRADYRIATKSDACRTCGNCSRNLTGWKGHGNHATPILNCKLLGIAINRDYTCREFKAA